MRIPNKRKFQRIAINHSSDIEFKYFMQLYRKYTAEPYSVLFNNETLPSNNPLHFKLNLLEGI